MNNKNNLAGVVTLYYPDVSTVENIGSYVHYLDCLYVINNEGADDIINELKKHYKNIEVIHESENMGIAFPLNQVLNKVKDKYEFLLTMDQDSRFFNGCIERYIAEIENFDWHSTLGIAPVLVDDTFNTHSLCTVAHRTDWIKKFRVITSGNIISVKNAIAIGGFDEKLFIDEVDHEFCYNGNSKGFFSYQCTNNIFLKHKIGNMVEVKLLGMIFYPPRYNYIRTYYNTRNRLYVYKKYHSLQEWWFLKYYLFSIIKLFVCKLFYEEDKKRRIKAIFIGIKDFINGKMGKKYNFDM